MRFYPRPKKPKDIAGCWHSWFAWYPVSINDVTVWFETIERASVGLPPFAREYEYRFKEISPSK